jgi:hypothetical protein
LNTEGDRLDFDPRLFPIIIAEERSRGGDFNVIETISGRNIGKPQQTTFKEAGPGATR